MICLLWYLSYLIFFEVPGSVLVSVINFEKFSDIFTSNITCIPFISGSPIAHVITFVIVLQFLDILPCFFILFSLCILFLQVSLHVFSSVAF